MRLTISCALAALVFSVTYLCAWLFLRGIPQVQGSGVLRAEFDLVHIAQALDEFRSENGRYPSELSELKGRGEGRLSFDESGRLLDPWGNPYVYELSDGHPEVYSYGQDGKPGGIGIYADICTDQTGFHTPRATLKQFILDLPSGRSAAWISVISAVVALVLHYSGSKRREGVKSPRAALAAGALAVTAAAVVFSFLLNLLHSIPTGH
jgi:hypothetical protein